MQFPCPLKFSFQGKAHHFREHRRRLVGDNGDNAICAEGGKGQREVIVSGPDAESLRPVTENIHDLRKVPRSLLDPHNKGNFACQAECGSRFNV